MNLRVKVLIVKLVILFFAGLSLEYTLCGGILTRLVVALCRSIGLAKRPASDPAAHGGLYSHQTRRHLELTRFIRSAALASDCRILDVGCGPGWLIQHLGEAGYANVAGCDRLDLDGAAFEYRKVDLNVEGLGAYSNDSFDVVIASDVLEHLENPGAALREFRRVLTPEGHLFLTLPNCCNIYERIVFLSTGNSSRYKVERPDRQHSHISMFPSNILRSLAGRASLKLVRVEGSYMFLFGHFWARLRHSLLAYGLMYHYVCDRQGEPTDGSSAQAP